MTSRNEGALKIGLAFLLKGLSINDLHTAEQDFANSTDRLREMRTRGET